MIFNLGSNTATYPLTVSGVPNATVTITNGKKTLSQVTDASGNTTFARLEKGTWDVTVTSGSESRTLSVEVSKNSGTLNVNAIPEFTYSGDYKIVNDSDSEITNAVKNWKIRFLTSGTLKFTALNGAADGIDVFCVGGGGNGKRSGGGGGYTTTQKNIAVTKGYSYSIVVGGATGESSGFGVSAKGGSSGSSGNNGAAGGNGGSGGGNGCGNLSSGHSGGSDGSDGYGDTYSAGGTGQGTTTREFGESDATLYAGGGGGATGGSGGDGGGGDATAGGTAGSGVANTGGGGGGAYISTNSYGGVVYGTPGSGGSGIVIIRNAR